MRSVLRTNGALNFGARKHGNLIADEEIDSVRLVVTNAAFEPSSLLEGLCKGLYSRRTWMASAVY
jgi:hypothetical protein